jgi:hypothetical protein
MNAKGTTHIAVLRANRSAAVAASLRRARTYEPHTTVRLDPRQTLMSRSIQFGFPKGTCSNPSFQRHMSMQQENFELDTKTLLRKFLLRVHPDRMAATPREQTLNEASLAELNAFLDQVDTIHGHGDGTRCTLQPTTKLRFYADDGVSAKRRVVEHNIVVPTRLKRLGAKRDWRTFGDYTLAVLFHLSGIEMSPAWTKLATAPIQSALSGHQPSPVPSVERHKTLDEIMQEAVQALHDAPDIAAPVYSLDHEENDRLYFLRTVMLHYDKRLTFNHKLKATNTFLENLSTIDFHEWKTVPIVISDRYHDGPTGFVTIPWDFNVASFKKYVRKHGPTAANAAIEDMLPPGFNAEGLSHKGAVDPHIYFRPRKGLSREDKDRRLDLLSKEFRGLKRPLRSHTARPGDKFSRRRK